MYARLFSRLKFDLFFFFLYFFSDRGIRLWIWLWKRGLLCLRLGVACNNRSCRDEYVEYAIFISLVLCWLSSFCIGYECNMIFLVCFVPLYLKILD